MEDGDSAALGRPVDMSCANKGQAQEQASSGSQQRLLAPSLGGAETARDVDLEVGDTEYTSMPRKLKTIVSGEPVVFTPTAEEVQNSQTQAQGLSMHA